MDNQPLFIVIIILVLFFIYNTTKPVKQPQPPKVPLARPYYQPVHTFNPMKQFYNHKYWG
jgi:hypothetical protein